MNTTNRTTGSRSVRTLFISDLHLGFRYARVRELLQFLQSHEPEELYLVGDFIDGWCLQKGWAWSLECNLIMTRLMELAHRGTRIRLVVGNHDNFLRDPILQCLVRLSGFFEVAETFDHQTADGRKFLVMHGDQFDHMEKVSPWIASALCRLYEVLLNANSWWSWLTAARLYGNCSLIARVKFRFQFFLNHADQFRSLVVAHARERGFQGVICGHVHAPQQARCDGIDYCNTGDWVESCTALFEDHGGQLKLFRLDEVS